MIATVHHLPSATSLEQHTRRVRQLMEDWSHNTIELGSELKQTRDDKFPPKGAGKTPKRPGWHKWLKELGISNSQANNLIRVAEKFAGDRHLHPGLSRELLVILSRPSTAREAFNEVIRRVKEGEKISTRKAKKIVQKHLPSPKKANEIAKQTGKPTVASDGYVYLGADAKDVKQSAERRTIVYAVRDAVSCLASINLTAAEFLEYAMPHQLWKAKEEHEIKDALCWLQALSKVWQKQ